MEQLFSTVAQISFTIVGLFFVVLTLDSRTRDYWFGHMDRSRYAYLNLFVMLFPGLLSIGALVKVDAGISALPFIAFFLWILYGWIGLQLLKMKKSSEVRGVKILEKRIDAFGSLIFYEVSLLFFTIVGAVAIVAQNQALTSVVDLLFGSFLFASVILSVLPVIGFLAIYVENKKTRRKETAPQAKKKMPSKKR